MFSLGNHLCCISFGNKKYQTMNMRICDQKRDKQRLSLLAKISYVTTIKWLYKYQKSIPEYVEGCEEGS